MGHTHRYRPEKRAQPRLGYLRSTILRQEQRKIRYLYEDEEESVQLGGQEPQAAQLGGQEQEQSRD